MPLIWFRALCFPRSVSVCPYNIVTGYTLFVEDEERSANAILTRSDMESHMVVNLGGRCAEKLVMGEGEVTGLGSPDMFHANMIAREMILQVGEGAGWLQPAGKVLHFAAAAFGSCFGGMCFALGREVYVWAGCVRRSMSIG